jgi:trigger factor
MSGSPSGPAGGAIGPYNRPAMQTNNTPLPNSRLQLEFELPSEQLDRAVVTAIGRLSRQVRVPGFRPGKAPRVMLERAVGPGAVVEEALDIVVSEAWRDAIKEQRIVPLTSPEVEVTQGEEGKPVKFTAVVQVAPEVKLGDFENFKFKPEIGPVDETMVDKVLDELRDAEGKLEPVADRGAQNGDYAIIAFNGLKDGLPFAGGSSERMPLILGEGRFIPGFEENILGRAIGDTTEFDITFPTDYQEESLRDQAVHFTVTIKELRAKVLPEATDEFAQSVGKFSGMDELRAELRKRLEANSVDRARHEFADKIIDYAVANATLEVPDVLVDQEVEVMHDEFRSALSRQGINQEVYLKVSNKTEADLHAEFRPDAVKRVKTLLVLTEVARAKGVEITDRDIQAEVDDARASYGSRPEIMRYFESERGRNYIKSTLRRSRTVEQIIDEWLAAHPESPRLVHLEDARESSPVAAMAAASESAPAGA